MKRTAKQPQYLYLRIAAVIEQQVAKNILKVGDRVPSLRTICREYGVSQGTALEAYYYLESKDVIASRPKSGYFVCNSPKKMLGVPNATNPDGAGFDGSIDALVSRVYHTIGSSNKIIPLSLGVPDNELLPVAKLNKGLVKAMREMPGSGVAMEEPQGNAKLRKQVARWSFAMEAKLDPANIITTAGCLNAISYCLMALTAAGDTIAMESPVSFGMIQVAQSLRLNIIELPTDTQTGVAPEALEHALKKGVKACLLTSNFSNPLGSCMPDENKKQAVRLLEKYNVPLIENDLNGDVYFGSHRPKSCKTFDESGLVLWCGSVSKTLAPGYRVGWVEAGRFKEKVLQMKLYHSITSTSITQEVVAGFLETGRYEAHLRKLRHTLYTNYLHYIRAIQTYFPAGSVRASRPQGGSVLWLQLDNGINTLELYERAIQKKISIAPGKMFTLKDQFHNCFRLNYGLCWNDKTAQALKTLGKLVYELS